MNGLPVHFEHMFDDGQAQAGSPFGTRTAFVHPIKALKKSWQMFGLDPHPVVRNFNQKLLAHIKNPHLGQALIVAVMNRIGKQIDQNLPNFFAVGADYKRMLTTCVDFDLDPTSPRFVVNRIKNILQQFMQIKIFPFHTDRTRLQFTDR